MNDQKDLLRKLLGPKTKMIKHVSSGRYWNVQDGWVENVERASKFSDKQYEHCNSAYELPLGGEWVSIK